MPGPWDGPVRVVARTPTSFRFATLDGHLEAGQIEFTAGGTDLLEFTIESWARAGDRLSNLLYDRLRMSKEIQLHMWTSVLERVASRSGGRLTGGVEIRTRRVDAGADPAIVRAAWDPGEPLLGRHMRLELRLFRVLRTHVGVRVTRVWDEERGSARVFGFEYATLPGHVEMGRMDYEVHKRLDDGAVEFRLHAHSRASGEGAPWTRVGFRLFGRRQQVRFYFRCCERVARLTARELGLPDDAPPPAVRLREPIP